MLGNLTKFFQVIGIVKLFMFIIRNIVKLSIACVVLAIVCWVVFYSPISDYVLGHMQSFFNYIKENYLVIHLFNHN